MFKVIGSNENCKKLSSKSTHLYGVGDGWSGGLTKPLPNNNPRGVRVEYVYDPARQVYVRPDGTTTTERSGVI